MVMVQRSPGPSMMDSSQGWSGVSVAACLMWAARIFGGNAVK